MIFDWYELFNHTEFLETGLVSRTYSVVLGSEGLVDVLVTQGNETGIQFRDVFLILNFDDQNPYVRDGYAIYKDPDGNVHLGIEVEEEE